MNHATKGNDDGEKHWKTRRPLHAGTTGGAFDTLPDLLRGNACLSLCVVGVELRQLRQLPAEATMASSTSNKGETVVNNYLACVQALTLAIVAGNEEDSKRAAHLASEFARGLTPDQIETAKLAAECEAGDILADDGPQPRPERLGCKPGTVVCDVHMNGKVYTIDDSTDEALVCWSYDGGDDISRPCGNPVIDENDNKGNNGDTLPTS